MSLPFEVYFARQKLNFISEARNYYKIDYTPNSGSTSADPPDGVLDVGENFVLDVAPDSIATIYWKAKKDDSTWLGQVYYQVPAYTSGWGSEDERLLFWGWVEQEGGARWSSL